MKKIYLLILLAVLFSGCEALENLTSSEVVEPGDTVTVNYVGRLEDEGVFDTSLREVAEDPIIKKADIFKPKLVYTPLKFTAGGGMVIEGFDEAVMGMREGEEKNVALPPEKSYGPWNEELTKVYPRVYIINVIETVKKEKFIKETGLEEFEKNTTVPWRYWRARIIAISPESIILRNEISDSTLNTELGVLDIEVDTGTITMTFTPVLGEEVTTLSGQFGPPRFSYINDTNFIIDFNHPLAGKTLNFTIKVESIEKVGT